MPTRHDYFALMKIVSEHIPQTHEMHRLGDIPGTVGMGIDLIQPKEPDPSKKNVLIVAGTHGEEIAGPWGITKFLVSGGIAKHPGANISLIPVINPNGFNRAQRYNEWHEVSNHGFFPEDNSAPSREGRILLDHIDELVELARDGFLTLHENADYDGYYFYMLDDGSNLDIKNKLLNSAKKKLSIQKSGKHQNKYEGHYEIVNGCVYNPQHDGTFENLMQSKGVPLCITDETPMHSIDLKDRVLVNKDAVDVFVTHIEDKKMTVQAEWDWMGSFLNPVAHGLEGPFKFDCTDAWGYCTAMDLFGCDPTKIRDEETIHHYVDSLCRMIGSKQIGPPQITRYGSPKVMGYSFTQLVSTSSITGHFVEQDNSAYLDVFFCTIYDANRVVALSKSTFGASEIHVKTFSRGPHNKTHKQ